MGTNYDNTCIYNWLYSPTMTITLSLERWSGRIVGTHHYHEYLHVPVDTKYMQIYFELTHMSRAGLKSSGPCRLGVRLWWYLL